jgi:hypothetical protein
MENVDIFIGHWKYITSNWYILWPFDDYINDNLVYFSPFWYIVSRKIWQTWFSQEVLFPYYKTEGLDSGSSQISPSQNEDVRNAMIDSETGEIPLPKGHKHRNLRIYARRSMFEKRRNFFGRSPPYFEK